MNLGAKKGAIHVKKVFFNGAKTVHKTEKSENWFSAVLAHMGAKKKYKAHISKYVWPILKYLRHIFCPLKTTLKHAPKMRTKHRHAPAGAGCRENIYPMIKINGNIVETRFIASPGLVYSAELIYETRWIASLQGWFVGRSPIRCRATRPNAN